MILIIDIKNVSLNNCPINPPLPFIDNQKDSTKKLHARYRSQTLFRECEITVFMKNTFRFYRKLICKPLEGTIEEQP